MSRGESMRALRIHGPLDMRMEHVPVPSIDTDQVLVRVEAAGICCTDIELFEGRMPYIRQGLTKLPLTPGHEWSGTVERVGEAVRSVKVGDKVVGDISLGCGRCHSCLRGAYHLCERRTEIGVIHEDGAYEVRLLTPDLAEGQPMAVVEAGCWQAARVKDGGAWSLCGCTVAPGFKYADFELADADALVQRFPQHEAVISRFTR